MPKRHVQLTLDQARRCTPGHGGWRPGAGRPRGRVDVAHETREEVDPSCPQHVTIRVVPGVNLRREWLVPTIHGAIRDSERPDFRVVEFNDLGTHLHFLIEAESAGALASGMIGLETRLAQRLNRRLGRRGELFVGRYHVRSLRTPAEVKNALRYVLLNARHHAAERGERLNPGWVDTYSSAPWFDGWCRPPASRRRLPPRPTATARTWLLAAGWRRHGLLSVDDVPGDSKRPCTSATSRR